MNPPYVVNFRKDQFVETFFIQAKTYSFAVCSALIMFHEVHGASSALRQFPAFVVNRQ